MIQARNGMYVMSSATRVCQNTKNETQRPWGTEKIYWIWMKKLCISASLCLNLFDTTASFHILHGKLQNMSRIGECVKGVKENWIWVYFPKFMPMFWSKHAGNLSIYAGFWCKHAGFWRYSKSGCFWENEFLFYLLIFYLFLNLHILLLGQNNLSWYIL